MAKMDFRKIRNEYIRRSMRYADGVRLLYDQALSDIAREFALVEYSPNVVFSFSEYGKFGRIDNIMTRLEEQIQAVINVGVENEFRHAYRAHEQLLRQVLGDNITTELERAFAPRITSGNAAKLYISETASNNITRSMRVWNGAALGQMETAVQEALMDGMPAKQMAGLIEQYLNDPDSCFRRFRIKTGVDADGKSMYGRKWMKRVRNEDGSTSWFDADPRDYPTGQGVYHSSYKNALRYTRTTTNIAYRTADYERYQTEDFVLGIEIHITGNPAHKEDICDMLQGRYPKDFKWTGWHPQCYSDDTEVYTKDGWKLFKDVKDDDLILSLNPQTRDLEYVPILLNISRPHKGKMVHFFNRSYSQLVTPEHDVLCVSKQDGRTFRRLKAEKCGKSQPIYRSSEWRGKKIESVAVGGLNVHFNIYAEFMGYWLSDGSLGHRWAVVIAQTDDDRSRIFNCIAKMGMRPRYNGGRIEFNNKDWYEYLQQFGKAADKYVPQEIKDSNADGIKVFLDAFVSCDGYTKKPHAFIGSHGNVCKSKEDERIYFTSSKRMADDIGELILKIGRRPSYKVRECAGTQQKFKNGTYTINYDHIIITECRSQYATQYNKEDIDYDGIVYDITLAKNNTLYIRHNGKCFWGSNCMCYEIPILTTPDEVNAMADAIMNDQDPSTVPVAGRVTDVPDNFKEWVANNQDRIQETIDKGKQLPYFLRDNGEVIDGKYIAHQFGEITIDANAQQKANLMSAAMELFNLQNEGYLPKDASLYKIVDLLEQNKLNEAEARLKTFLTAAERHAGRTSDDIRRIQDLADVRKYGQAYVDNVHKIENALGIKRGKRMTHEEANMGRVNPNWGQPGFNNNCSTCSATYILRTMGFNVQAKAKLATNPKVVTLSRGINAWGKWENGKTHYHPISYWMRDKGYEQMSPQRYMSFIKDFAKEEGVYEFVLGYKKSIGGGHSTLLRVLRDGTIEMIEQQRMTSMTLETLLKDLEEKPSYVMGLFRVDNAMFNAYFSDIVEIIQ